MDWNSKNAFAAVVLFVCSILCIRIESCSPPIGGMPPDSVESRVSFADVVAYGKVIQHYTDSSAPFDSFTAELEIYCVFKGAPVPQYINVTNAGIVGGLCFSTILDIGKSYVVYLRRDVGDWYTPNDSDVLVLDLLDPYFENLTRVCDQQTEYPIGVTEANAKFQCPLTDQTPNCVRHIKPTPPVGPTGEIFPASEYETTTESLPPLKDFKDPDVKVVGKSDTASSDPTGGCETQIISGLLGFAGIVVNLFVLYP